MPLIPMPVVAARSDYSSDRSAVTIRRRERAAVAERRIVAEISAGPRDVRSEVGMVELHPVVEHRDHDVGRAAREAPRLERSYVARPLAIRERPLHLKQRIVRRTVCTRWLGLTGGSGEARRGEHCGGQRLESHGAHSPAYLPPAHGASADVGHAAVAVRVFDAADDDLVVAVLGDALGVRMLGNACRDLAREKIERRVRTAVAEAYVEPADGNEAARVGLLTARGDTLDEHGIFYARGLAAVPQGRAILLPGDVPNAQTAELIGRELDLVADGEMRAIALDGAHAQTHRPVLDGRRIARIRLRQHGATGC